MRVHSAVALIAAATLAAACGGERAASTGSAGGTVIIAAPGDALSLFPPLIGDQVGRWVADQIFDRLAEIGQDLSTVGDKGFTPRLAKRWTWSRDSLSIAFSLDPRARWHDGRPVRASDVRYSFKVFTDPKVGSPTAPLLANIDSISVRDSLTAVAWFKQRKPEQFYDLAYQLLIIPEHIYGSIPADQLHTSEITRHPIGSGRFKLEKWDAGTRISLIADTANYRGRPKLDRVIFTPMDSPGAATAVLTGQVDFVDNFPFAQLPRLDSSTVARSIVFPQMGYAFAAMNANARRSNAPHPIFSDRRVRRALSMAVDRVAMLHNVFGSAGRLNHGPFPMTLAVADSTVQVPPYDTAAANALLDSAGWRRGPDGIRTKAGRPLRFTMAISAPSIPRNAYGVLMQEAFRKVGVQADIERLEPNAMNDKVTHGDFDMVLLTFGVDPSPTDTKQFWATSGIGPTGQNYYHYSNRVADALMDSITTAPDQAASRAYAKRAFQTIDDDLPAIWLYDAVVVEAVNRRITTAPMRADAWWANLADWSIPPDKRIDRDRIGLTPTKP